MAKDVATEYPDIDETVIIFDGKHCGSRVLRTGAQIRIHHGGLVQIWSPRQLKWNDPIGVDGILAAELAHAMRSPWTRLDMSNEATHPERGAVQFGPYYVVLHELDERHPRVDLHYWDGKNFWTDDGGMSKGKHVLAWCRIPKVPELS